MKLDKIKFAQVVAYIGKLKPEISVDVYALDSMIEVDVPIVEKQYVSAELVDELLKQMFIGAKIPAIKAYRELCHAGLKESKDAVEKYWGNKSYSHSTDNATLDDILHSAGRDKAGNDITGI